jgi:AcrR family transcriptional regulator
VLEDVERDRLVLHLFDRVPLEERAHRGVGIVEELRSLPPSRLDVEERRKQLVALGIELFAERTYDDVSIDELAHAAGISKGLLYHYFPTKRDFYIATVKQAAQELLDRTRRPRAWIRLSACARGSTRTSITS